MSEHATSVPEYPKAPRRHTTFLKRRIISSDSHEFVARLFDLGIVSLHFDSYEQLSRFSDIKYVIDVERSVTLLTQRVESLNLVGDLLWPEPYPSDFRLLPVSHYQWLVMATDLFLVRYTSVVDCALILANRILLMGISSRQCTIDIMTKKGLPSELAHQFKRMLEEQHTIRAERHARIHHGRERTFTWDDQTFRLASTLYHRGAALGGADMFGREIDLEASFREGLAWLQLEFNRQTRRLQKGLDVLYDLLWPEFEGRFAPLVAAATHGLNANARIAGGKPRNVSE